jgi:hypothetical protein
MKRIITVMAVAALMAVMLVAMAMPAFAAKYDNPAGSKGGPSDTMGPTDPTPGTCTLQQGNGGGGGANDSYHGACK